MKQIAHYNLLFFILLTSSFILPCCTGSKQYRALLERADSLMTAHPDSAYAILTSIDSADIHKQRKAIRMRYQLLRAEAGNASIYKHT